MADIKTIKNSTIKKLLPRRDVASHKGQNGRVLVVGGSLDYYGAPLLAGLGALNSGADLAFLYGPECNFECTRSIYPDFIVKKFKGDSLSKDAVAEIVEFGNKKCDSVLIGPGLGDGDEVLEAVKEIVLNLRIPTVLDADAIQVLKKIEKFPLQQPIVITPHSNEFRNLVDREVIVAKTDPKSVILLRSISMDLHINVLLKGPVDYVSSDEGNVQINLTGNSGMTVGGTGDVLAGVVARYLAAGIEGFDAARCAAFLVGEAGDYVYKQKNENFVASDVAMALPYVI